jgi:hypothetical protein
MVILNCKVNGKDLRYSVIRVGSSRSDLKGPVVANPNGSHYAAICRTCGFGAASTFPGHAIQLLLFSIGHGDEHRHSTTAAHIQIDPAAIDRIYDALGQASGNRGQL